MLEVLVWGIKRTVKQAPTHVMVLHGCPENKLFISNKVCPAVLCWAHASKLVPHPGRQRFWCPTMACDTCAHVLSCPVCAQSKTSNSPPAGLLRPLPIPLPHIALDFVTGLLPSAGNNIILTRAPRYICSQKVICSQVIHSSPTP